MLDLDDLAVSDEALKSSDVSEVKKYVMALIRHEELLKLTNKRNFRELKTLMYDSHANIDPMTCEEVIIHQTLKDKAEIFIKARKEILELKNICSKLPSIQEIKSLTLTDKVHIELIAHTFYKSITFDNSVIDEVQSGIDALLNIVYKTSRNQSKLKNIIKSILHRLLGSEGMYFYGIKVRRSNLHDVDIRTFALQLLKYNDAQKQRRVFTDFCAIFLYSDKSDYCIKNESIQEEEQTVQIGLEDFVIKCNVFRCIEKSHQINDILALINILDDDGNILVKKVPAGYCKECNLYFILNSTYQSLKKIGIIMCRISDEKLYRKSEYMKGRKLANESLLMQYGYNVSEMEGLSSIQRHNILSVIIDNNILSKSEIISYIDFFISQRRTMENMKTAILKWEEDREFVKNYETEGADQIHVRNIYRN